MTDYLTLTEFVPGTKAKAQDVNANFSLIKDALNQKANMDGDNLQKFNVADAVQDSHAVNLGQLDDLEDYLKAEIKKASTKFCVKSGNVTSGKGDLFSYDVLRITPKIGGVYANLVFSDYQGIQTTVSSATIISMTGKPDGDYNIFIKSDGTLYTLANTIYKQPARPTMVDGDIWLNTSVDLFNCIKYDGTNDVQFLDMPLGKVTVKTSAITAIETFPFNQNGHNINTQSTLKSGTSLAASISSLAMPNYANGVNKVWNTLYQAESNGYLYVNATFGATLSISLDNSTWQTIAYSWFYDQGFSAGAILPISKGVYYKATYSSTTSSGRLVFYPCVAV